MPANNGGFQYVSAQALHLGLIKSVLSYGLFDATVVHDWLSQHRALYLAAAMMDSSGGYGGLVAMIDGWWRADTLLVLTPVPRVPAIVEALRFELAATSVGVVEGIAAVALLPGWTAGDQIAIVRATWYTD